MNELTTEMRFFYLHREVSISLVEAAYLYSKGERPTLPQLIDWTVKRRGLDDESDERAALIVAHLRHAAYGKNGLQTDDLEAWFAAAEPIAVVFALGAAAARAGNFSGDQAQAHALNVGGEA